MLRWCYAPLLPGWLICLGLLALFEVRPVAAAAEPGGAYRVTHWTVQDGLPQSTITALLQTREGYLWIGTLRGLARFDGLRFKVFDQSNAPEMTHDSVNDLAEDPKEDGLWIGTGSGLLCYRGKRFERYGPEQSVPGPVGVLEPAVQGGVWFSPRPGQVALAHDHEVKLWEFGPADDEFFVHQIRAEAPRRLLILAGPPGALLRLRRLDLDSATLTAFNGPREETGYYSFYRQANGTFWVCGSQGVWRGREGGWEHLSNVRAPSKAYRQNVYPASEGKVWVVRFEPGGTTLNQLIDGELQPFGPPEVAGRLTRVLEDREQSLWVGTRSGLFRLEPKRLQAYARADGLASGDTLAVSTASDGSILVGTAEGMNCIRNGKVYDVPPPPWYNESKRVAVFLADRENGIWLGGPNGDLAHFQDGQWKGVRCSRELKGDARALFEDHEGRLWIATGDGLLCRERAKPATERAAAAQGGSTGTSASERAKECWRYFCRTNGLSHPDIRLIYQDRQGDLWFGSYGGGLIRFQDGEFTTFATRRGSYNNRAWCIHEDNEGVFWIGSENGLNRFVPPRGKHKPAAENTTIAQSIGERQLHKVERNDQTQRLFFTFTQAEGLHDPVINNIQEDEFGYLWLSGLHGIYRVARKQLNEVASGIRARVDCAALGEADGMLNSECNGGDNQPAGCKDWNGNIWFPTMQGVVVIDPKRMEKINLRPPVLIEEVKANERLVFEGTADRRESTDHRLRLKPGQARLVEIHYTALTFANPERVDFKYRLRGHDEDWVMDDDNRRLVFYTNLRPGSYVFEVMARSAHGIWSERSAQFAFYVAPHLWEIWSFWLASGSVLFLASVGIHRVRIRQVQRIQLLEQQRLLQEERTRIARDLHDDLGPSLTGLALQMDLVRTQNSIPEKAQQQLTRLAQNTRGLVDNMREVVWAMNPQQDNLEGLAGFLSQYAETYLQAAGLRCRLELPIQMESVPLGSQARHQLYLVIKEALHNIVRHAHATEVQFRLEQQDGRLEILLADDGRGLCPDQEQRPDHGLENMRQRVSKLGGEFTTQCEPGRGTRLRISVPLEL